jgi:hypothetical protein
MTDAVEEVIAGAFACARRAMSCAQEDRLY